MLEATLDFDGAEYLLYAPFQSKDYLKNDGWRWSPERRAWRRESLYGFNVDNLRRIFMVHTTEEAYKRIQNLHTDFLKSVRAREMTIGFSRLGNGKELYDYQKTGIAFIRQVGRCILGDALGLGKTVQSLAAFAEEKSVLIVVPKTLIPQWTEEIKNTLGRTAIVVDNRSYEKANGQFLVTNYEQLLRIRYPKHHSAIIFDEAVRVKNHRSKTAQAAARFSYLADKVVFLTGTPIRNSPQDVWPMLQMLRREPLEDSVYWNFIRHYCVVRQYDRYTDIGPLRKNMTEEFQRELYPYFLRRERNEVNLPSLTRQIVNLDMTAQQAKYQKEIVQGLLATPNQDLQTTEALQKIMRMRQISVDPTVLGLEGGSPKTAWLKELLDDTEEQILVFGFFKEYIKLLGQELENNDITVSYLYGQQSALARQKEIDHFKEGNTRVMLAEFETGSVGLNLQHACHIVVWTDLPWTPDTLEQGTGRVWRNGQKDAVTEYILMMNGGIDWDIYELLEEKKKQANRVIRMEELIRKVREQYGQK